MTERAQGDRVEQAERRRVQAPELSWALREVIRAAGGVDHRLAARMRLRSMEFAAIQHVMDAPDAIGPAELSGRLGISTGSGTELVDRLEAAGHLARHRHPQDRRRITLQATENAVTAVIGELTPLLADIDSLTMDFTPQEQDVITRYLRAAAARMRHFADGGQ